MTKLSSIDIFYTKYWPTTKDSSDSNIKSLKWIEIKSNLNLMEYFNVIKLEIFEKKTLLSLKILVI